MSNSPAILSRLKNVKGDAAKRQWSACCPAHDDRQSSLSISIGDNGKTIVKCHAGCTPEQINAATGGEVFSNGHATNGHANGKPKKQKSGNGGKSLPTAEAAIARWDFVLKKDGWRRVRRWQYHDAWMLRYENSAGLKTYRPVSKWPDGWRLSDPPGKWTLYRLDELRGDSAVWIHEGEGCVDAAIQLEFSATTSAHGSQSADKTNWEPLAGRDVVIVPDNDDAGEKYAADVVRLLHALDPPARAKIVRLKEIEPQLKPGDDVVDLVELWDGKTPDEIRGAIEAKAAATDDSTTPPPASRLPAPLSFDQLVLAFPTLRPPIIDGLLRRGETGNVISLTKVGKSWMADGIAIRCAVGGEWFGFQCEKSNVLIIDNELHPETSAYRIARIADAMKLSHGDFAPRLHVQNLRGHNADLNDIAGYLERYKPGAFDLIVLDAWYRAFPDGVSENDNAQITSLYNLIDSITQRLRCAWLNVHHVSKGSQADKVVTDVGSGAGSQSRAADAHLILRPHEVDDCVVMQGEVRSWPKVAPIVLKWDFPLWRKIEGLDPTQLENSATKKQRENDQRGMAKIVELLRETAATASVIRDRTRMGLPRVARLLSTMERDKVITSQGVDVNGNSCKEYRLNEAF